MSAAPADRAAPTGAGIAASAGSMTPDELPDVLLSPDVAVLERAVRERPDVAAAVLDQMRYGQLHSSAPAPPAQRRRRSADEPATAGPLGRAGPGGR